MSGIEQRKQFAVRIGAPKVVDMAGLEKWSKQLEGYLDTAVFNISARRIPAYADVRMLAKVHNLTNIHRLLRFRAMHFQPNLDIVLCGKVATDSQSFGDLF